MPRYQITSPDGKTWEVSAPEGATQDQVLEYAKSQWSKSQPAAKAAPIQAAPPEDPGMLKSLLVGAGRTFDRVGKGAQQIYYGATGDDKALADLKASAESDDAVYKPLQQLRPWSTGIGEALPSMVIPGGGGATLGANMLRMAAAGAIPGALEYGSVGERAGRAALGATAGAAMPLAGAVLKTGKAFAEPLWQGGRERIAGRLLNQVAGDDAANVAQKLAQASELVPGSAPTAAQVAENGGIAALERAASQANPSAYTQRAMEQSSARLNALRGIAGDDAAMEAAKTARDQAAKSLYGQAFNADGMRRSLVAGQAAEARALNGVGGNVQVDDLATPGLRELMKRPMFQQAAQEAKTLAANHGVELGDPTQSLQGLHYIKLALDDMSQTTATSALGRNASAAAESMKGKLADELAKVAPLYGNARTTFAQMSEPINQMQVGQALYNKASPALADFGALGRESGATFATALRNGDAVAQKATGFGGATIRDVLTPEQMRTVENIAKDLARKANAQDLGRGVGSDTFQKLAMNNIAQQSGMPRMMGGLMSLPGVGRATRWIYEDADKQMQALLADSLLNPKASAELMTKSTRGLLANDPIKRQLLEQSLLRAGLLGAPAAYSLTE